MESNMLSSRDILKQTGISRATLNNYIALGILPKPVMSPDELGDRAQPRMGYFPDTALDLIDNVRRLKRSGKSMKQISKMLVDGISLPPEIGNETGNYNRGGENNGVGDALGSMVSCTRESGVNGLRLTLDQINTPAYMVNSRFQIEWSNPAADAELLSLPGGLPSEIGERNVFRLLLQALSDTPPQGLDDLIRFHLAIAKNRFSKSALLTLDPDLSDADVGVISRLYDEVDPVGAQDGPQASDIDLGSWEGDADMHRVHASFFREGIFFAYAPLCDQQNTLQDFLARRDIVIRELLKNRKPYLTNLSVLVADLQDSMKICAELPPEEYFELINQLWGAMELTLRKYSATRGKHVGDGIVYYFFPQPDSNASFNAIQCAHEMSRIMSEIDQEWRARKRWSNRLVLNFGLDEGQEWFGTYQTPTHIEFTVLGDTINRAARISDFARDGSIWVTKNLMGTLSSDERTGVHYGIRHKGTDSDEVLVTDTYARINNLVDLENPRFYKFQDIAVLPVTELFNLNR